MNLYFLGIENNLWSNSNNWGVIDGHPEEPPWWTVPSINDDVFFTANSRDCVQDNPTPPSIKSFNSTGYTNTLYIPTITIFVYGDITIGNQTKLHPDNRAFVLQVSGNVTTNGVIIPSFRFGANGVVATLIDVLTTNAITIPPSLLAIGFAGNFGFITQLFSNDSPGACVITLQAGITYTVKGLFSNNKVRGNAHASYVSSTVGTKAKLTVTGDAKIGYVDFTDIDASQGRTLYTFGGVVTNCLNINTMTDRILPTNTTVSSSRIS